MSDVIQRIRECTGEIPVKVNTTHQADTALGKCTANMSVELRDGRR